MDVEGEGDVMLYALAKLVSIPTVSDDIHRERQVLPQNVTSRVFVLTFLLVVGKGRIYCAKSFLSWAHRRSL